MILVLKKKQIIKSLHLHSQKVNPLFVIIKSSSFVTNKITDHTYVLNEFVYIGMKVAQMKGFAFEIIINMHEKEKMQVTINSCFATVFQRSSYSGL